MSADIVNLRQARKKRARVEREKKAAENRVAFGRPLTERRHSAATRQIQNDKLDGAQRSDAPQEGESDG
jgi:hypothetical protein